MARVNLGFTFKQFFVAHDRCAMKVNTDAVILAAWATVCQQGRVLDIGTGSGVMALMMAQRTPECVYVDAIELDVIAAKQAQENFSVSRFANRLTGISNNVINYAKQTNLQYDRIICNPPYFPEGVKCQSQARHQARYTQTLDHSQLFDVAKSLLKDEGIFTFVLPYNMGYQRISQAQVRGWKPYRLLAVKDSEERLPHLLCVELVKPPPLMDEQHVKEQTLIIRDKQRHFTDAFIALTKDFYLNI